MKRPVFFFIINIHFVDKNRRLIIPLPLFLVEMIAQGAIVWKPVIKKIAKSKSISKITDDVTRQIGVEFDIKQVFIMLMELWLEFRALGKFEFVNVETPDMKLKIYTY